MDSYCRRMHVAALSIAETTDYTRGFFSSSDAGEADNIIMLYRWPGRKIPPSASRLYHKRYVLTFNLNGHGAACINEKTVEMPVGSALLIFPFQLHYYMVDQEDFNWLVITFDSGSAVLAALMNRSVPLTSVSRRLIARMLELYVGLQQRNVVEDVMLLKYYLNVLLLELCRSAGKTAAVAESDDNTVTLIERINGYIYAHLARPELSLREIAAENGISVGYLCVLFRKKLTCGPGEYIREARINRAISMLRSGDRMVAEVAEQCGFSSAAVFCRCFRRMTGCSPREYPFST